MSWAASHPRTTALIVLTFGCLTALAAGVALPVVLAGLGFFFAIAVKL